MIRGGWLVGCFLVRFSPSLDDPVLKQMEDKKSKAVYKFLVTNLIIKPVSESNGELD